MAVLDQLEIRINGIDTTGLRMHRRMVEGYPSGPWDVLVEVPILGYIELDDKPDFVIEFKDPTLPAKSRTWNKVSLAELVNWLESSGVTKGL